MAFCSDMKLLVCVLTTLFGMSSWIAVNAVFIELPIFVSHLPEGWNLPSYLSVIVQIANIGPLIYTVWRVVKPELIHENIFVISIVSIGSLAILLLAFVWKETSNIGGEDHSTALLILTFVLSVSSCMSSVVFLPFMSRINAKYMTPYFVGMGLSGFAPSVVSLGQGVENTKCENNSQAINGTNEPLYSVAEVHKSPVISVKYFFVIIFTIMVISGLSFVMLNYLPYCKSEHVQTNGTTSGQQEGSEENQDKVKKIGDKTGKTAQDLCTKNNIIYLFVLAWQNALLNGVLLSVQSFACLPYGKEIYRYSVTGAKIIDPLAGFLNFFITVETGKGIGGLTILGSVFAAYIVAVAAMSPSPVFVESSFGGLLVVSTCFRISKSIFREEG